MSGTKVAGAPHAKASSGDPESAVSDADAGALPAAVLDATGTAPDLAGLTPAARPAEDLTTVLAALREAAARHDPRDGAVPGNRSPAGRPRGRAPGGVSGYLRGLAR